MQSTPTIAVWEDAVVITTEQTGFSPTGGPSGGLYGANVYAMEKRALVLGASEADTALVMTYPQNRDSLINYLVPARQTGSCSLHNTFLMATTSTQLQPSANPPKSLKLLSLLGTWTLGDANPSVRLVWVNRDVLLDFHYSTPPAATQKPGVNPHGQAPLPFGWNTTGIQTLETGPGQLASLVFVDDVLYASWGTALAVDGNQVAAVAWALIDPEYPFRSKSDGVLGLAGGNHLLIPALAVRPGGKGVLAVSISGPDFWPSAGYAVLHGDRFVSMHVTAAGVGVTDDTFGYTTPGLLNPFGYFATALVAPDGRFWLASQYVAQTCTLEQFLSPLPPTPLTFTCNQTRTLRTNWATRITEIQFEHMD